MVMGQLIPAKYVNITKLECSDSY